jgi:hypothetical protein
MLINNNLPHAVNNAKVVSIAGDTKLFKCVDSHIYHASIQSDLDNLGEWSTSLDLYLITQFKQSYKSRLMK